MKNTEETYEGGQLKGMYEQGFSQRESYLNRARECAKLTIPTLIRDEGSSWATTFETPFQSIGARGANHLASKL